ncbi:MAG: TIGR04013 family B12-binding domain/radical SAM domain-containing protein [Candidatus Lokiarchaeota archaeon]|nr:TIGR04013 family B12-binding domain/radical SAM domain-containing protein [Candidatus Lokiarchaeota archaeon]
MGLDALIFQTHSVSRYSLAALLGAIESDSRLSDLIIEAPFRPSMNLIERYARRGEVLVAHSVMSTQTKRVYNNVKKIRDQFSEVKIVGGGPHASIRPGELIDAGFDYVVIGEGERKFTELLHYLMHDKDPSELGGIITTKQEEYPKPKEFEIVNLDDYAPFALERNILGPIEVTRGCPFSCRFCSTPFLTGSIVRHRSVDCIVKWLKRAVQQSGFDRAWFLSPNALSYGGRGRKAELTKLENLLQQATSIQGLDEIYFGSFPSEVRPEFVNRQALTMLRQHVANQTLQIGIQSGSDRILQEVNRHHSVEEGISAAIIALDCGFKPNIDMIFGFPSETPKDQKLTIDLCYELIEMGASVHAHIFMPLPGSFYENETLGILTDDTRRHLGTLARKGMVTGSWGNQEKIAMDLAARSRKDIAKG